MAPQRETAPDTPQMRLTSHAAAVPEQQLLRRNTRWLARGYERLPDTLRGLHFLAFAILMAQRFVQCMAFCL